MRTVLYLAIAVAAIAGMVWLVQNARLRNHNNLAGRPTPLPLPALDVDFEQPAEVAYGSDRGPGTLRLSPSQLVFTAGSGRVVAIERIDIIGVSVTAELPDRTIAKPVLAIATNSGIHYFAVPTPDEWERRLL